MSFEASPIHALHFATRLRPAIGCFMYLRRPQKSEPRLCRNNTCGNVERLASGCAPMGGLEGAFEDELRSGLGAMGTMNSAGTPMLLARRRRVEAEAKFNRLGWESLEYYEQL